MKMAQIPETNVFRTYPELGPNSQMRISQEEYDTAHAYIITFMTGDRATINPDRLRICTWIIESAAAGVIVVKEAE